MKLITLYSIVFKEGRYNCFCIGTFVLKSMNWKWWILWSFSFMHPTYLVKVFCGIGSASPIRKVRKKLFDVSNSLYVMISYIFLIFSSTDWIFVSFFFWKLNVVGIRHHEMTDYTKEFQRLLLIFWEKKAISVWAEVLKNALMRMIWEIEKSWYTTDFTKKIQRHLPMLWKIEGNFRWSWSTEEGYHTHDLRKGCIMKWLIS